MIRVAFVIDGFNLYHSVRDIRRYMHRCAKWLDIWSLCESCLPNICQTGKEKTELAGVYYFSALAHHLAKEKPGTVERHEAYLECLRSTGVTVELHPFKPKDVRCKVCRELFVRYEEKETDVAIGMKVMELFTEKRCETTVIISGDTDLKPIVTTCQTLFPDKKLLFAFPYKRMNDALKILAPDSFRIRPKRYFNHQLPNPVTLKSGRAIHMPPTWC